ncbi:MAG TPA: hypothetical protein VKG83_05245 [Mycobacterium sp.]|nr:hypothetical protein [Mycobacterium sp.]
MGRGVADWLATWDRKLDAVGISRTPELLTVTGLGHAEAESEAGLLQHLW